MKSRHLFLSLLTMLSVASVAAQTTAAGSDIVSRTLLSSDGTRAVEQRVYDNGLGDVVQEIQSYPGSTLPSVVIRHEYDEYSAGQGAGCPSHPPAAASSAAALFPAWHSRSMATRLPSHARSMTPSCRRSPPHYTRPVPSGRATARR